MDAILRAAMARREMEMAESRRIDFREPEPDEFEPPKVGESCRLCGHHRAKRKTKTTPAVELFWRHVTRGTDEACWVWWGAKSKSGLDGRQPRLGSQSARRVAMDALGMQLPPGDVGHCPDNDLCVNPRHFSRTEVRRKLSDTQRREVLALIAAGRPDRVIAGLYGITPTAVARVRQGRIWKRLQEAA